MDRIEAEGIGDIAELLAIPDPTSGTTSTAVMFRPKVEQVLAQTHTK